MRKIVIAAIAQNNVIGKGNTIPWRLPKDMNFFKETTTGHTVIMGRKTYDSFPQKFRPLPNRTNIVITGNNDIEKEAGVIYVHSFEEALLEAER